MWLNSQHEYNENPVWSCEYSVQRSRKNGHWTHTKMRSIAIYPNDKVLKSQVGNMQCTCKACPLSTQLGKFRAVGRVYCRSLCAFVIMALRRLREGHCQAVRGRRCSRNSPPTGSGSICHWNSTRRLQCNRKCCWAKSTWSTIRQQDGFIVLSPLRQPLPALGGQLQAAILDVKMICFSEIGW